MSALHAADDAVPELEGEVFGELEDAFGPDDIFAVIGTFREEVQSRLGRMINASEASDVVAVRREAHAIKGAAATIGLAKLSRMASVIELTAHDTPSSRIARDLNALRTCYQRSIEIVEARIGSTTRPAPPNQLEKCLPS